MLGAAFRRAPVRERDAVHLARALREDATDERRSAVDRGQRVARPQLAHRLPSGRRLDQRVERLRLPHARTSGDDDEVGGLQARRLEVELLETRGDAGDVLLPLVEALDVLERVLEDLADGQRAAFQPPLGQAEDALLGVVHERLHVLLGVEGLPDDVRRGLDQLAQHRHVAHDRRVGAEVGGDRRLFHEQGDGGGAADELELVGAAQLLVERQRVDRRAAVEEGEHRLVDRAVGLRVEVRGPQDFHHARQGLAALQEHGAEHGALGVEIVRRDARRNFERAHRRVSPRIMRDDP